LQDQITAFLTAPDNEYSDSKLTSQIRQYISEVEKNYLSTITDYKSHISPSFWEFKPTHFNVS
jgi:hypothetical protein